MRPDPPRMHLLAAVAVVLLVAGLARATVPRDFKRTIALLQPAERARLEAQAATWARWTATQRRAFAARAAAWDALPVPTRQQRREAWQAWASLTSAERMRLREEAARLARLPPAERQALRARFEAQDATTRRGWLLGPVLGADYARLQPLLAQMPADQHAPLLRTLRALTPAQRADLAVLVQRTPPQARDRLRRELVSTADSNRDAWLRLSLER